MESLSPAQPASFRKGVLILTAWQKAAWGGTDMIRVIVFLSIFGLLPLTATAEIYRCREVGGILVFTDDPARFPPSCSVEARPSPKGWASFVETSSYMLSDYVAVGLRDVVALTANKKQLARDFRDRANALVKEYRQARYSRLHSRYVRDRRELAAAIREIQAQKLLFLEEVDEARITTEHREEIETILAAIPSRPSASP